MSRHSSPPDSLSEPVELWSGRQLGECRGPGPWTVAMETRSKSLVSEGRSVWAWGGWANVSFGVSTVSGQPLPRPMYYGCQRCYTMYTKFKASLWLIG